MGPNTDPHKVFGRLGFFPTGILVDGRKNSGENWKTTVWMYCMSPMVINKGSSIPTSTGVSAGFLKHQLYCSLLLGGMGKRGSPFQGGCV